MPKAYWIAKVTVIQPDAYTAYMADYWADCVFGLETGKY
jgi:uncharacterized protein (DUF1330 family)